MHDLHRIVSDVQYDVDDVPISWRWGTQVSPDRRHEVARDMLGRVTEIRDHIDGTNKTRLTFDEGAGYDGDGDLQKIIDSRPAAPILVTSTSVPVTRSHVYDATRDILKQWDENDGNHNTTLSSEGFRTVEVIGSTLYTVSRAAGSEQYQTRTGSGAQTVELSYDDATGDVTKVDAPIGSTVELEDIVYGPRGNITSMSISDGAWTFFQDDRMNRWKRNKGFNEWLYRYDTSGRVIDYVAQSTGGVFQRDEFIYLNGVAVGSTHTDNTYPSARSWWLSPDQMGTPRRALVRDDTMAQKNRLVMNPWGGKASEIFVSGSYGQPHLPLRLPGQIGDDISKLVENKWRTYFPDLGVYLSPDPAHRSSARLAGPQAYAYANGNPLKYTDPDGRRPLLGAGTHFRNEKDTAFAAAMAMRASVVTTARATVAEPECPEGTYLDSALLCSPICRFASDCSANERCLIQSLDEQLGDEPVFADEVEAEIMEAMALTEELETEPLLDEPTECEGNCSANTVGLPIRATVPAGICVTG